MTRTASGHLRFTRNTFADCPHATLKGMNGDGRLSQDTFRSSDCKT